MSASVYERFPDAAMAVLERRGLKVYVKDGQPFIGPRERVSDADRAFAREHKPALIEALKRQATFDALAWDVDRAVLFMRARYLDCAELLGGGEFPADADAAIEAAFAAQSMGELCRATRLLLAPPDGREPCPVAA